MQNENDYLSDRLAHEFHSVCNWTEHKLQKPNRI